MKTKKGYRVSKNGTGWNLCCWYDAGTGRIWDRLPSQYATRMAASAAGKRWVNA